MSKSLPPPGTAPTAQASRTRQKRRLFILAAFRATCACCRDQAAECTADCPIYAFRPKGNTPTQRQWPKSKGPVRLGEVVGRIVRDLARQRRRNRRRATAPQSGRRA